MRRLFLPEIEPRMVERVPVQFINGPRLEYPRGVLEHDFIIPWLDSALQSLELLYLQSPEIAGFA